MEHDETKGVRQSTSRSNLSWNLIAIISIIATILALYYYRLSYFDPINGVAISRYNTYMSFSLLLMPVFWLLGIRIKWMAIPLQIIPILLFIIGLDVRLIAFWPASLINYSLVYKFLSERKDLGNNYGFKNS